MPPYDNFFISFKKHGINFEMFHGQLNSVQMLTDDQERIRIKRLIAGHRFLWRATEKFSISFGEQIIYSGEKRSVEMVYLNPFIPFFTAGFNIEGEEHDITSYGDNDNSFLFFHGRYNSAKHKSIYFEFIIDDFQIDNTNLDNQLAFTIGTEGKLNLKNDFFYAIEWSKIDRWTYIHGGQFTNWLHFNHPIGYLFGSDLSNVQIHFKYQLKQYLEIVANINHIRKGENSLFSQWNNGQEHISETEFNYVNVGTINIITKFNDYSINIGVTNNLIKNDFVISRIDKPDYYKFFISINHEFSRNLFLKSNHK